MSLENYYALLIEAEQASARVDAFDLRDNAESRLRAAELTEEDRRAQAALIEFVAENLEKLRALFGIKWA